MLKVEDRLFLRRDEVELDDDFVGNDRGVFPFTRADIELRAFDGQRAIESLRRALARNGDRHSDVLRLALDGQLTADVELRTACRRNCRGGERSRREMGGIEPVLVGRLLVVAVIAEIVASRIDAEI